VAAVEAGLLRGVQRHVPREHELASQRREVVLFGGVAAIEPTSQLEQRALEEGVDELVVEVAALEREVGDAPRPHRSEATAQQHLHQVAADVPNLLVAVLRRALVGLRQDLELQAGDLHHADPRPDEAVVAPPAKDRRLPSVFARALAAIEPVVEALGQHAARRRPELDAVGVGVRPHDAATLEDGHAQHQVPLAPTSSSKACFSHSSAALPRGRKAGCTSHATWSTYSSWSKPSTVFSSSFCVVRKVPLRARCRAPPSACRRP
jgi:hypothetical protein